MQSIYDNLQLYTTVWLYNEIYLIRYKLYHEFIIAPGSECVEFLHWLTVFIIACVTDSISFTHFMNNRLYFSSVVWKIVTILLLMILPRVVPIC